MGTNPSLNSAWSMYYFTWKYKSKVYLVPMNKFILCKVKSTDSNMHGQRWMFANLNEIFLHKKWFSKPVVREWHMHKNVIKLQCRLLTSLPFLRVSCETPASPTRVKLTHIPSRIHALFAKLFIWTNQKRVVPAQDSRQIILLIWPAIIYACQRRDILANKYTTNAVRGYWGHLVFRTVPVFLIS